MLPWHFKGEGAGDAFTVPYSPVQRELVWSVTRSRIRSRALFFMSRGDVEYTLQIQGDAFLNVEVRTLSIELNLLFFRSTGGGEGLASSVPAPLT